MEANPGTVSAEALAGLRRLGVNRLSLGVQSLHDDELELLGRIHTAAEAAEAVSLARAAGLDNLSLDLIYGLPRQPLAAWQADLEQALDLAPDHLSLYALSVEEGTPLAAAVAAGHLPEPDPDLAADMYELAHERLDAAGYVHYEISNWARPGFECRHNLGYWRNEPYLGLGAGAHSYLDGRRRAAVSRPAEYVRRVLAGESAVDTDEAIGPALEMGETMMMGLRLLDEGVAYDRFRRRFGRDLRRVYAAGLAALERRGLIHLLPDRVRLSPRGRLLGNQVFMEFLPDEE
jgi:oxygen-independent coproporphyrinogen-3 oxidase